MNLTQLKYNLGNVRAVITDHKFISGTNEPLYKAELLSATDYYAYGSPQYGRTYTSQTGKYRFGFNTQEKTDEISGEGNHNTALFWEYDTRLGRRWNLDPKPQVNISDYTAMGGNPILNMDWLGDEFVTPEDKKRAEDRKVDLKDKAAKLTKQRKILAKSTEKSEEKDAKLKDYDKRIKSLNNAADEIEQLEKSPDQYTFKYVPNQTGQAGAGVSGLNDLGQFEIQYSDNESEVHELKHAFQYHKGQINFKGDDPLYTNYKDINDEVEAHQRDYAYNNQQRSYLDITSMDEITPDFVSNSATKYAQMPKDNRSIHTMCSQIGPCRSDSKLRNYDESHKLLRNANIGRISINAVLNDFAQ